MGVLFCSGSLDLLPPRPKLSFRYLKRGVRGFRGKYVLAPAGGAANSVVVLWRLYCVNALRQELGGAEACGRISANGGSVVGARSVDVAAGFAVGVWGGGGGGRGGDGTDPVLCWLPGLRGRPCGASFVAGSGSYAAAVLSRLLASCLAAVEGHWIGYCGTVCEGDGIGYFWSNGNSNDVLNGFGSKNFQASRLSAYGFSALYTTLPHHLVKDGLVDLVGRAFVREGARCLACGGGCAFFASGVYGGRGLWSCRGVCSALACLLGGVFVGFGAGLCRQTIGVPVGAGCAPLVAGLFLFLLWGGGGGWFPGVSLA